MTAMMNDGYYASPSYPHSDGVSIDIVDAHGNCIATLTRDMLTKADWAEAQILAAAPDLLYVAELALTARAAQRAYFADRTKDNLIASKQAERALDIAIGAALAKVKGESA